MPTQAGKFQWGKFDEINAFGNAWLGKLGSEFAYKKWSVGSELMLPLSSNLVWYFCKL